MRFLLAANFVRDMPWTPAWWAVTLARGLAERGHEVELAMDGTEVSDASAFGVPVHVARRDRIHLGAHPGRFQALIRSLREGSDATLLSLTPLIAGDVWLAVDPSPLQVARRLIRDLKPISLALELSHHPWIGFEAWAAWRATKRQPAPLRFGPPDRSTVGLADGPASGPTFLPRVSTLTPRAAERAWASSQSMRERLGVTGQVATLSLPEVDRSVIAAFFRDLAHASRARPSPLTLVVATTRPHTVTSLAAQAGLARVKPITLTRSIPAIVAASDLVLAPPAQSPPPPGGQSGRWIADAVALGVPVIASASAPGSELLQASAARGSVWNTREELASLLAATPPRERRAAAPPGIPADVSLDRLLERLEELAKV